MEYGEQITHDLFNKLLSDIIPETQSIENCCSTKQNYKHHHLKFKTNKSHNSKKIRHLGIEIIVTCVEKSDI